MGWLVGVPKGIGPDIPTIIQNHGLGLFPRWESAEVQRFDGGHGPGRRRGTEGPNSIPSPGYAFHDGGVRGAIPGRPRVFAGHVHVLSAGHHLPLGVLVAQQGVLRGVQEGDDRVGPLPDRHRAHPDLWRAAGLLAAKAPPKTTKDTAPC